MIIIIYCFWSNILLKYVRLTSSVEKFETKIFHQIFAISQVSNFLCQICYQSSVAKVETEFFRQTCSQTSVQNVETNQMSVENVKVEFFRRTFAIGRVSKMSKLNCFIKFLQPFVCRNVKTDILHQIFALR